MLLALWLWPLPVQAQTEFIVRLGDDAPAPLVAALEQGEAAKRGYPSLFENVAQARAVFAQAAPSKRLDAPFRAYTIQVDDARALASARAAWEAQPGVLYVQPNHRYRLDALEARRDDPLLDSLTHLPLIGAFDAWSVTTGSPDVRIGFVDTGVFFEHPDLAGQFWVHPGEDLNGNGLADPGDLNGLDDDGNGFIDDVQGYDFVDRAASVEQGDYLARDPDASEDERPGGGRGHGTLIAGALAARLDNGEGIAGVAPGCKLLPLRAFGADGLGDDDDVAAAIVYAAQLGVEVLNLSFGDVYYSPLMEEAIAYAVARGTVVVASGGNLGGDAPHYPSDYPDVISVVWLNADGTGIASRGASGIGIDLGAPGSFVFTTTLPRRDEEGVVLPDELYGRRSGSSMAAPQVAGAAALLRSLDATLSPASIQGILAGTAADIGEPGWDHRTGAGRLDVAAALQRALPSRVEIDHPRHDTGWAGDALAIVGTAVDPAFASYVVEYAVGDEDLADDWERIAGPETRQRRRDTLGVWQTGGLPEGVYTVRLAATLRTGRTLEDRRRVYLDRSPPQVDLHLFNIGLVGPSHGVVADVATDDLSDIEMHVTLAGREETVHSDRRARRHGVRWSDETGRGGAAHVRLTATNAAGLATTTTADFTIPARQVHTALFRETTLSVPHGYLLPRATDFDRDGLLEVTLNRYQDGWIGDTLATYEWTGEDFRPAASLLANVIPRDVGDPDDDGLLDLLTQVGGATLVLEQPDGDAYPTAVSFLDTTGLANPFDEASAFGARFTDLDGDGRGEILVHNTRQWRLLEAEGGAYREVVRLENPTSTANSEISQNEFQQPLAVVADFDGDGQRNLLVGDGDGDWIVYEARGDNTLDVTWTYETRRYNAGARFAHGDFDGDGLPEFVTFTQNWTQPTGAGEREPDIGLYYFWDGVGDDAFVLADSLPVANNLSRHGAMAAVDFDGDGRDELALIHAPDLYVLAFDDAMRWRLLYHRGPLDGPSPAGLRSIALVADDFDGDGYPELLAAGADERLHRFVYDAPNAGRRPPRWEQAVALDEARVRLAWRAEEADSVTVYRGPPEGPLDVVSTTTEGVLIDAVRAPSRYLLRGWRGGEPSPLSEARVVRPHAPAVIESVVYPEINSVELIFTEALQASLRADQFTLAAGGPPAALLPGRSGRSVVLRFDAPASRADTLRWTGVVDAEGTPVGQTAVAVVFPESPTETLIVTAWELLGPYTLDLTFNAPLDPAFATDLTNYRLQPSGEVVAAAWTPDQAARVTLEVEGRPLGATGQETTLVVVRMQSVAGEGLAPEGSTLLLAQAAADLDEVYVFPNPYREGTHQPRMMVAGLPPGATVRIFSVQGVPVRRLEEQGGAGGVAWDLRDENGQPVPSGVYLVRAEADGHDPVLRKAAIIR